MRLIRPVVKVTSMAKVAPITRTHRVRSAPSGASRPRQLPDWQADQPQHREQELRAGRVARIVSARVGRCLSTAPSSHRPVHRRRRYTRFENESPQEMSVALSLIFGAVAHQRHPAPSRELLDQAQRKLLAMVLNGSAALVDGAIKV